MKTGRPYMSIGEVLGGLKPDFPDDHDLEDPVPGDARG